MPDFSNDQRRFIGQAMAAPYLTREEEIELTRAWSAAGDEEALHRLVTAHMRLVISVAGKFRRYALPMGDLIQEGHIGLLEAAARFDPGREVRFSTYATWWIRASVQDHVLRNWSIVRGGTSSTQKTLFFSLRKLRARLTRAGDLPRSRLHAEIASRLRVSEADVAAMDGRLSGNDVSLNAPAGEDPANGAEKQDFLVSEQPLPDEIAGGRIDAERDRTWLANALNTLDKRELSIIRERRLSDDAATLDSLGRRLGVSKERVRQIEARALQKLKVALRQTRPAGAHFTH